LFVILVDINMLAAQTEGNINHITYGMTNNFIGAFDRMLKRKGHNVCILHLTLLYPRGGE